MLLLQANPHLRNRCSITEYYEADPSPLATQTVKFFNELEAEKAATGQNFWDSFCELNSSAPECKTYDV